jgi:uncharacterized protein
MKTILSKAQEGIARYLTTVLLGFGVLIGYFAWIATGILLHWRSMETFTQPLAAKYRALQEYIRSLESAVVAFSGGIDSSLVAFVAHRELGPKALAVTSGSESLKQDDLILCQRLARQWGMSHRIIHTQEIENEHYRANPVNRCYYCKTTLYVRLEAIAKEVGFKAILNGTNIDDLGDHRPGLTAAREHRVHSPLLVCEFGKNDIRKLSRFLGLENSEKPQAACLSSRVPYGTPISIRVLSQIEKAENLLGVLGFHQYRVRHHDTIARIEVMPEEFPKVIELNRIIEERFKEYGYQYVALDLGGFRSGSLNDVLKKK